MSKFIPSLRVVAKAAIGVTVLTCLATIALGDEHGHQHPTKGPHGGAIVELGDEELHAEVLHDDAAGTVTVYLLDGEVKRYMTIASPEIVINVRHNKKAVQFKLKAKPQSSDRDGRSSRFEVKNQQLVELLDAHDAEAQLKLVVGKRSYVGKIVHNHDHDHGHDHNHDN